MKINDIKIYNFFNISFMIIESSTPEPRSPQRSPRLGAQVVLTGDLVDTVRPGDELHLGTASYRVPMRLVI